eukprot:Gb_23933 [translate_table: standard]
MALWRVRNSSSSSAAEISMDWVQQRQAVRRNINANHGIRSSPFSKQYRHISDRYVHSAIPRWVVEIRSLFSHLRVVEGVDSVRLRIGASRSHFGLAKPYDIFGNGKPGDEEYRKAWEKEMDEETCLWSGSDSEDEKLRTKALKKHYELTDSEDENPDADKKKDDVFPEAKEEDQGEPINADDSDELRSVWSGSDEEKTLWSGSEDDDDDDIPTPARPHERSDRYLDKVFEFEEAPRFKTLAELIKGEPNKEELSPGKQARKLALENALKKLKKGPDGRYTNVWEVITDLDVLIGSFENIVSGPEYADLRAGGPKKLNMQFFKDLQERLRNGTFEFTPEIKLKPKSRFVLRKKWQRVKARERKLNRR